MEPYLLAPVALPDGQVRMGHAFDSLPLLERARKSREMADALLDLSLNSQNTEMIVAYLDLAAGWLAQARGLEREAGETPPAKERIREADLAEFERR